MEYANAFEILFVLYVPRCFTRQEINVRDNIVLQLLQNFLGVAGLTVTDIQRARLYTEVHT